MFVFIYHSSSHVDDNKGRKAASRIEKVRNREGKRRKERETELKGRLKRWKTNGNGKETEEGS